MVTITNLIQLIAVVSNPGNQEGPERSHLPPIPQERALALRPDEWVNRPRRPSSTPVGMELTASPTCQINSMRSRDARVYSCDDLLTLKDLPLELASKKTPTVLMEPDANVESFDRLSPILSESENNSARFAEVSAETPIARPRITSSGSKRYTRTSSVLSNLTAASTPMSSTPDVNVVAWARKATVGYSDVSITNLTTSWRDGLAFCALLHYYRPDLVPFHDLDATDFRANLYFAFSVGAYLGIKTDKANPLTVDTMVSQDTIDSLMVEKYLRNLYSVLVSDTGYDPSRDSGVVSPGSQMSNSFPNYLLPPQARNREDSMTTVTSLQPSMRRPSVTPLNQRLEPPSNHWPNYYIPPYHELQPLGRHVSYHSTRGSPVYYELFDGYDGEDAHCPSLSSGFGEGIARQYRSTASISSGSDTPKLPCSLLCGKKPSKPSHTKESPEYKSVTVADIPLGEQWLKAKQKLKQIKSSYAEVHLKYKVAAEIHDQPRMSELTSQLRSLEYEKMVASRRKKCLQLLLEEQKLVEKYNRFSGLSRSSNKCDVASWQREMDLILTKRSEILSVIQSLEAETESDRVWERQLQSMR